jgi:hypothetical protein
MHYQWVASHSWNWRMGTRTCRPIRFTGNAFNRASSYARFAGMRSINATSRMVYTSGLTSFACSSPNSASKVSPEDGGIPAVASWSAPGPPVGASIHALCLPDAIPEFRVVMESPSRILVKFSPSLVGGSSGSHSRSNEAPPSCLHGGWGGGKGEPTCTPILPP